MNNFFYIFTIYIFPIVLVYFPCVCSVAQLCLTFCDLMDSSLSSLPGPSVSGIFQARILKWVAISSSREFSQPRDQTCVMNSLPLAPPRKPKSNRQRSPVGYCLNGFKELDTTEPLNPSTSMKGQRSSHCSTSSPSH